MKGNPVPLIFYRKRLHPHAVRQQVILLENRSHPVQDMIAGFPDIIGYHIFKGKHPFYIHITSPRDQVLLICIFTGKLVADQMASVIQIFSIHDVIFHSLPSGGLHLADTPPLFRRHQICPHTGISRAASSLSVQLSVFFEGFFCPFLLRKIGFIAVNLYVGFAGILRKLRQRNDFSFPGMPAVAAA